MMDEIEILAETYHDKMDISRHTTIKKPNGATSSKFGVVYADIPCAISRAQNGAIYEEATSNSTSYNMTLFARPDVDIVIGDTLTITRFNSKVSEFIAGEPMYYESHIEVPIARKVVA